MLFKSLPIPHAGLAAQDIDGSFVAVVLMRIGPSVRRESYDLQIWILRAPTDCAEIPGVYKCPCFPLTSAPAPTTRQVGVASSIAMSGITSSFSSVISRLLLIRRHGCGSGN